MAEGTSLGSRLIFYALPCFYKHVLLFYDVVLFLRQLWLRKSQAVATGEKNDIRSIDVFITCFKEPCGVVEETIDAAVASIEYMREQKEQIPVRLYLLDDSGRAELRAYTRSKQGVFYIARSRREHAKAGNLNNALQSGTTGDAIIFLDADANLVLDGVFKLYSSLHGRDSRVAWIQGIKSFEKRMPCDKKYMRWLDALEADNSSPWIICSTNFYNGIFIGSGAIFMRDPLSRIGYIPTGGVGEDVDTSFLMQQSGYVGISINHVITNELPCRAVESLITQRVRWHNGDWQRLRLYRTSRNLNGVFVNTSCFLGGVNVWLSACVDLLFLYQRSQVVICYYCVSTLFDVVRFVVLCAICGGEFARSELLKAYLRATLGARLLKAPLHFFMFPRAADGALQLLRYDEFVSSGEEAQRDGVSSHDRIFHLLEKPYTLLYWTVLLILDVFSWHLKSRVWIRATFLFTAVYLSLHAVCIQLFSYFETYTRFLLISHHFLEILVGFALVSIGSDSDMWHGYVFQRVLLTTELARVLRLKSSGVLNRFVRFAAAPFVVVLYAQSGVGYHRLYFTITLVSGSLNYSSVRGCWFYRSLFLSLVALYALRHLTTV